MTSQIFMEELLDAAGFDFQTVESSNDTTIGIFQSFRPDGLPETLPWQAITGGDQFQRRLADVFEAVRHSRRSDTLQDAYFIVRNPPMLTAEQAESHAKQLVEQLADVSEAIGLEAGIRVFGNRPKVRVLEGKAPKHPRRLEEKCRLLLLLQTDLPAAFDDLFVLDSLGARLSEALYFISCDRLLRDYLRWPLISQEHGKKLAEHDPLRPYFELWRHGAKYRVFADDQIDIYLPRRADGTLVDAGQFAMKKQIDS